MGPRALAPYGLVFALVLAACASEPPPRPPGLNEGALTPLGWTDLPDWPGEAPAQALPALLSSCQSQFYSGLSAADQFGTSGAWQAFCQALNGVQPGDLGGLLAVVERDLRPFEISGQSGSDGLITGYFEAEVRGSSVPVGAYVYPVYGRPGDLLSRDGAGGAREMGREISGQWQPYFTRAEIEAGASPAPILFWTDDPIALYLLQVQGSGQVIFSDGAIKRVGVAATNGLTYQSIGRILVERGEITLEEASWPRIDAWLRAHPGEQTALFHENPRFVFFALRDGDQGPSGSLGVALTPGRSIAVDPQFIPLGVPVYLSTAWPDGAGLLNRLTSAQDTGGAITGARRADLFWGAGAQALALAGQMRSGGRLFLLLPR